MGFKLGKARQPYMSYGNLRSKLKFGGEQGGDASVPCIIDLFILNPILSVFIFNHIIYSFIVNFICI